MRFGRLLSLIVLVCACEKGTGSSAEPPKKEPSAQPSSSVGAPLETGASASVVASASAANPVAEPRAAIDGGAAPTKGASKHLTGNNYALDLASQACKAGLDCVMTVTLVAQGDYHVNKEYPYKFVATETPGVAYLGKSAPETFTRAAGEFVMEGEKSGTMTVRFKPASAGNVRIAGTYKFSVCSDDQCQVEQEKIELSVPVM
ncbi:MAG TPA: hypothetical protein VM580_32820 [Labilithrix sp.]|nr:hypothetical protein [Labilithrix sp.]